jgi:hypothetical protein
MVLDTDSVFHGVDRVADVPVEELPRIRPGTTLEFVGDRQWELRSAEGEGLATYEWDQLRFSVSWKAYCFYDAHERDTWRDHRDDLTIDVILDRLIADMVDRGRVTADVARDSELGLALIHEYVTFPSNSL